jgi:transcriptional regulator of arginine metabolism
MDKGRRMSKIQRQQRVSEILDREVISTAAQLVTRLQSEGYAATQATVTRDLQDLGTVKIRDSHGSRRIVVASTPAVSAAPIDHLRRMMGEWAGSIEHSLNIVIVRTPPGCAHVVASALDRSALDNVMGSIAGDDTILVIADEHFGGAALAAQLRELAGLNDEANAKRKGVK